MLKPLHVALVALLVLYFFFHLFFLDRFPVFADEAIYIRWSQLIIDDAARYAFFPLNDGKTPLFMWLMVPFQFLISNQLVAGRIVSVIAGGFTVLVMSRITAALGGSARAQWMTALLTALLPYWFFHHHMALIESTLVLWLSICVWASVKVVRIALKSKRPQIFDPSLFLWLTIFATSWGLALLTKLPAILFLPSFFLITLLPSENRDRGLSKTVRLRLRICLYLILACTTGFLLPLLLRLHPAFSQLFARGSDFLFPFNEVFLEGKWVQTIHNLPSYSLYFFQYLTPSLCLVLLIGLFTKKHQQVVHVLFWSGILFVLPIALLGRVVFARYLFPATIFFTLAGALTLDSLFFLCLDETRFKKKVVMSLVYALLIANVIGHSFAFDWSFLGNFNTTPFVSSDRLQYLEEWSSGHGVKETTELITKEASQRRVAVATEGFFGTLPDGILLYLHRRDVSNLLVEGVGITITGLPDSFVKKATQYETAWLVVNEHRMAMELNPDLLVAQYCRPNQAPCLQVWDVTTLVHK